MAPRPRYERGFSFAAFQANQPKKSLPGQRLDIELDEIAQNLSLAGASAYDLAVQAGFVGTEAEWLVSLQGSELTASQLAVPGNPVGDAITLATGVPDAQISTFSIVRKLFVSDSGATYVEGGAPGDYGYIADKNGRGFKLATAQPELDVRFAGLKGDGSNESALITKILTAGAGKRVIWPAGTFTGEMQTAPFTRMTAQGQGRTVFRRPNSATGTAPVLFGVGGRGRVYEGFSIDGNSAAQIKDDAHLAYGFLNFRTDGSIVRDIDIYDTWGIGHGEAESNHSLNERIRQTYSRNLQCGYYVGNSSFLDGAGHHIYKDCNSDQTELGGMIIDCDNVTVDGGEWLNGGTIKYPPGGALGAAGIFGDYRRVYSGINIRNAIIRRSSEWGIDLQCCNSTIENNQVTDSGLGGVAIRYDSYAVNVLGNFIDQNGNVAPDANTNAYLNTLWSHSAIQFDGCTSIRIQNNRGVDGRGSAATQRYGVQYMAQREAKFISVLDNDFRFNTMDGDNVDPSIYGYNQGAGKLVSLTYRKLNQ
jgi:hypothetical protein